MQKTKSMFFIGNAIAMIALTSSPAPVGASVNDAIRDTPLLSGPEIIEGMNVTKKLLDGEKAKNGVDTERYDVLSQIQTTLIAKAEQAGLNYEQMLQTDLDTDVGAAARANQALGSKLNGGSHSRTGHAS